VTLVELRAAYDADRAEIDARHPPLPLPDTCRYCRKSWRHWKGGRFDGHVSCAISRVFARQLVMFLRSDPRHTFASVAVALGLSPSIVRAWWHVAHRRA
jgi:hypothetical protein